MQILHQTSTLEALCKATGKYGMLISWWSAAVPPEDLFTELQKAAPYLTMEHAQAMIESQAFLLFDTREEMERHYDLTVGDDGPTELNSYSGPLRVYALTCNPEGQLENENT